MTNEQLKDAIARELYIVWARARERYTGLSEWPPRFAFRLRGRRAGAVKFYHSGRQGRGFFLSPNNFEFHWNLEIARGDPEAYLATIVPHEAAHVVALVLYGNGTHDRQWQAICMSLGGSPDRCHSFDVPQDRRPRVQCGCPGGTTMGPIQYKRMTSGATTYVCRRCGEVCKP